MFILCLYSRRFCGAYIKRRLKNDQSECSSRRARTLPKILNVASESTRAAAAGGGFPARALTSRSNGCFAFGLKAEREISRGQSLSFVRLNEQPLPATCPSLLGPRQQREAAGRAVRSEEGKEASISACESRCAAHINNTTSCWTTRQIRSSVSESTAAAFCLGSQHLFSLLASFLGPRGTNSVEQTFDPVQTGRVSTNCGTRRQDGMGPLFMASGSS